MKQQDKKTSFPWGQLNRTGFSLDLLKTFLILLSPVLTLLLIKRNDLSLKEDLARLCIFTTCTALGWYLTLQKRSRHAQLRKPLLLESPPEKL